MESDSLVKVLRKVAGKMGKRPSLYLRDKKDKDIIDYVTPLLDTEDFSSVIRGLVRDGIKYRQGVRSAVSPTMSSNVEVLQSQTPDLGGIELAKKEASDEEIKARLDDF